MCTWIEKSLKRKYVCHVPAFYNDVIAGNNTSELVSNLKENSWLTPSLKEELSNYYPSEENVTDDHINHDNIMAKTPFQKKCEDFFGYHREFMNRKQIHEAIDNLCSNWNIVTHKGSCAMTCAYGVPLRQSGKIFESNNESTEWRKNLNCPFIIRYSPVNQRRKDKKDGIFFKFRVTMVNAKHTCLMSNSAFRCAKVTSKSRNIDLDKLKTAVHALKINPYLKSRELRPLLANTLPASTFICSKFLNNFRRRVALFHA